MTMIVKVDYLVVKTYKSSRVTEMAFNHVDEVIQEIIRLLDDGYEFLQFTSFQNCILIRRPLGNGHVSITK